MNKIKFQNWIVFTAYSESLGLCMHLKKEGKNVTLAQIDDLKIIGTKGSAEEKDTKKRRTSPGDGLIEKTTAEKMIEKLSKVKDTDKDNYFIIFDFNSLHPLADKVLKMGFVHGLFPSKFDYKLENDRAFGKEFVQMYYPDLKVAPMEEYKSIEEGIDMVLDSEEFWALKGNDICCQTVVPCTKNLGFAKEEIIDALRSHKEDYERQGFILEKQIRDGIEFCPQAIFYNGEPVAYSVDLENKAIGNANLSIKGGCAMDVVVSIPNDAEIVKIAFPEVVQKLAKKHKGLYYMDANIILKDGIYYYLEFCSNRMGYDAYQTECEMAGGVSNYFEALANGESPYQSKYGVAVRGFNLHRDHDGNSAKDMTIRWNEEIEDQIYFYDCRRDDKTGKYVNSGYEWELLAVFTGSSDDVDYAIIKAYEAIEGFSFDELYFRSYDDFICRNYDGNILDRLDAIEDIIKEPEESAGE